MCEAQLLQPTIDALKAQRTHTATVDGFVPHDPRSSSTLSVGDNVMWVTRQMEHRDWTITAKKYGRWSHRWFPTPAPGRRLSGIR
ncbi:MULTISPECIES: hypothetical protein [Bacteria]|jgi:integrase|uniref:hypothetical protein n=1 Tax=Bacteria TaxID=2 RepID=UPI00069D0CD4|nr:hypothetical protein [Stenotrophomonas geniculata]MDH7548442.1 hypothetical protein [Stenotrophomonas geniculata]